MEKADSTSPSLAISYQIYQAILDHCQSELPIEACGLLSGNEGVIQSHWPMTNIDRSPHSFSMSLAQIAQAFESVEALNEQTLAIYHSHPTTPAYPSPGDIQLNNYPELVYIIISLQSSHPDFRAYKLVGDQVFPCPVHFFC